MNTFNIERAVSYMENYINTYKDQPDYREYNEKTFIEDMLYGLGVSLSNGHRSSYGFTEFKKKLIHDGYFKEKSNED